LATLGIRQVIVFYGNPEGIATGLRAAGTTLSGCAFPPNDIRDPRVAKAQPWTEIGEHLRCKPDWGVANNAMAPSHRETEKEFKLNQYLALSG
jgi:hypothetical protein